MPKSIIKNSDIDKQLNPITARIFEELQRIGKTRYRLCKAIGIPESTISMNKYRRNAWSTGKIFIDIANYLNVSPEYLLTGKHKYYSIDNDIIKRYDEQISSLTKENAELKSKLRQLKKVLKGFESINDSLPAFLKSL